MDEGFIRRTYRTSAWVLALVLLYMLGLGAFRVAWSYAAGALLGLGVLRAYEWIVQRMAAPGRKPPTWLIVKLTVVKLPALALLLYLVVNSGWFHLGAFAAGVVLPQGVMFLKALGLVLVQREEERRRRDARAR